MRHIRIIAALLVTLMSVSLFSSCGSKKNVLDNKIVRAEDPWYESTRFNVSYDLKASQGYESCYVTYVNDKTYVFSVLYDYFFYERDRVLCVFDDSGNMEKEIPVICENFEQITSVFSINPNSKGDKASVIVETFEPGGFKTCFGELDLDTGKVTDLRVLVDMNGQPFSSGYSFLGVFDCDDYAAAVLPSDGDMNIYIFEKDECISKMSHSGLMALSYVDQCTFDKDSKLIAVSAVLRDDGSYCTFKVDPQSGEVSDFKTIEDDAQNSITDYYYAGNGDLLKVDSLGNILKYNYNDPEPEVKIANNWYSPYFSDFENKTRVLDYSDDKIVILTESSEDMGYLMTTNNTVTVLKKAKTNPHADKRVIEISAPIDGYFSEYMSDAIYMFNQIDDEYLIRVWGKYSTGVKSGRKISSLDAESEKLYTLVQELQGADAPDLVMDLQRSSVMNDTYLEDLTDYLDPEVKSKQYENIIDAAKANGRSYFLPVTINIEGLAVKDADVDKGSVGIDFDGFDRYIDEKLSGFNPYDYPFSYDYNKKSFFLSCIDINSALGDKVDFDSKQFRMAAEYAKNNFYEDKPPKDVEYDENKNVPEGRYVKLQSYTDFIHSIKTNEELYRVIGTPNVDSKGPRFNVVESISVAADSDMKDGCRKFINFLFDGSFALQKESYYNIICTNKDVMAHDVPLVAESNNRAYKRDIDSEVVMKSSMDFFGYKETTDELSDSFLKFISDVSVYNYADPDIVLILDEEMAPYFAGDRSIDDVIEYLNDRVGKYLSEMS